MTRQAMEGIDYQGQSLEMPNQPLGRYFDLGGYSPPFDDSCSMLWRGYVGTWEINQGRLYLIKLHGTLQDGTTATLATVFPNYPERVFAHWYSGTLHIYGQIKPDVSAGGRQEDIQLRIEKGIVVQTGE